MTCFPINSFVLSDFFCNFAERNIIMKNEKQIATSAAEFAERWKGRGYERGESQPFWIDLLSNMFGIVNIPRTHKIKHLYEIRGMRVLIGSLMLSSVW